MMHSSLSSLPVEIIHLIYGSALSLQDLHSLACSCKYLNTVFMQGNRHRYYHSILSRTIPAFEDALRTQRASVAAMRYLVKLGFLAKDLESLLSEQDTKHAAMPVCYFDLEEEEYVNIPSEAEIQELGEGVVRSTYEAKRIFMTHKLVMSFLNKAKLPEDLAELNELWFEPSLTHPSLLRVDTDGCETAAWTREQDERFIRGIYRVWLFGYLYFPGCFYEPLVKEREGLRDPGDEERFSDDDQWIFENGVPEVLNGYPVYSTRVVSKWRWRHLFKLFDGFTNWLVHDGEKRCETELMDGRLCQAEWLHGQRVFWKREGFEAKNHGGKRELLLLHDIGLFLAENFYEDLEDFDDKEAKDTPQVSETEPNTITLSFTERVGSDVTRWQTSHGEISRGCIKYPQQLPSPANVISEINLMDGYYIVPDFEFLALALCKHYGLEISEDIAYVHQIGAEYRLTGNAVMDEDIYPVLQDLGEGYEGTSEYGKEMAKVWQKIKSLD